MRNITPNTLGIAIKVALFASIAATSTALAAANTSAATVANDDELPTIDLDTLEVVINAQNSYVLTHTDSATGLDLSPKETPQSFTTMTEKQMKDQNVQYLKDALRQSTGVNAIALDGKRVVFSSRGFDVEQYFVDGLDVDFTQQQSTGENLANIGIYDHISIVRGSTGLLSGSGEPSAAITLHRKRATSHMPTGEISVNANNFNNYGIMADVGSKLNTSGTVRGRVVAAHQNGGSYVDREKRGFTTLYGAIDADIGQNTEVSLGYSHQKTKWRESMWGGLPVFYTDGSHIDWDTGKNVSAAFSNWDTTNQTLFADLKHYFTNGTELSVKGSHSNNKGDPLLMYASGAVDKDTGLLWGSFPRGRLTGSLANTHDFTVMPTKFHLGRKQQSYQADLKGTFEALGRTHDWLIGADYSKIKRFSYYYDDDNALYPAAALPSYYDWDGSYAGRPSFGAISPYLGYTDVAIKEKSVYGTLRIKPTDKLAVILGGRVSDYDRDGVVINAASHKESGVFTPYGGLVFDVNDNHSLYASYASIYKPQDDAIGTDDKLLAPKEGNTIEVGWKGSTTDGSLTAQVALFDIKQKNYPVDSTVRRSDRPWLFYKEGIDATSRGIEMEVSGKITPQLHATLGFSHAKVDNGSGTPIRTEHPATKVNAFGTYTPTSLPKLTLGAGMTYNSSRYHLIVNPVSGSTEKLTQKPVVLANVMAKYQLNDHWNAQVNVNNVFNKKYFDINVPFDQIMYQEPLSIVGKISYQF